MAARIATRRDKPTMDNLIDFPAPVRHPARYSDALLPVLARILAHSKRILDPFAGTGRIHALGLRGETYGIELEPEWAAMHPRTQQGNALALPFGDGYFDAICTSPAYGNRMADHHEARDASRRNTYTHALGRQLHPDNAGKLQWGDAYKDFHRRAWAEAARVLQPGGLFVLNVADHIRAGRRMHVSQWHVDTLLCMGFALRDTQEVPTPGLRHGANAASRVGFEYVFTLVKVGRAPPMMTHAIDPTQTMDDDLDRDLRIADELDHYLEALLDWSEP
jgi:SAM-dependent methyltransferase